MYARGTWSLAAFLVIGSPMPAQAQKEPPLKMVYAVWKSAGGAANILAGMNKKTYDMIEAYVVLVKDTAGTTKVKQRGNKTGGDPTAMRASEIVDNAVARLSALPSPDSAKAYVTPNGPASHLSDKDLKKVATMLHPGQSGLLMITPKPDVSEVERFMGMGSQGKPEVVVADLE